MHKLSASFILGYHGCEASVAEQLLRNQPFIQSKNDWDWLGEGVYFWEANPRRGLQFAMEAANRRGTKIEEPAVVGAVIDLGFCLDLTTSAGLHETKLAYSKFKTLMELAGIPLPANLPDGRHNLDCAVVNFLHRLRGGSDLLFDTVKGIFIEDPVLYPGSAFRLEKPHPDRRPQSGLHQGRFPRPRCRSRPRHLSTLLP